jgi:hypothetical protein
VQAQEMQDQSLFSPMLNTNAEKMYFGMQQTNLSKGKKTTLQTNRSSKCHQSNLNFIHRKNIKYE